MDEGGVMGSLPHERRTENSPLLLTLQSLGELYKKNVRGGLGQNLTGKGGVEMKRKELQMANVAVLSRCLL